MVILSSTTKTEDYSSEWINGDKKKFEDLASFQDGKAIKNWALQLQWENVVGTADAEIKVYSTLENVKTLEHTYTIETTSNVGDAHIIDMSGTIIAGFNVELVMNNATSIVLSIDAIID
jgi:hypothetical protein